MAENHVFQIYKDSDVDITDILAVMEEHNREYQIHSMPEDLRAELIQKTTAPNIKIHITCHGFPVTPKAVDVTNFIHSEDLFLACVHGDMEKEIELSGVHPDSIPPDPVEMEKVRELLRKRSAERPPPEEYDPITGEIFKPFKR